MKNDILKNVPVGRDRAQAGRRGTFFLSPVLVFVLVFVLGLGSGCKSAPTDQQITTAIQAKINAEQALAGQNIQISVANGVATLSGAVNDEASRALAANDSGVVPGVKTVINNLSVQSAQQATPAPQPAPTQPPTAPAEKRSAEEKRERRDRQRKQSPAPTPAPAQQVAQQVAPAAPPQAAAPAPPPPPPAPPKPVVKEVTLAAGTVLPVRVTETISSKDAQANDVFHASIAGDLGTQGVIAIPRGTPVLGRIVDAKDAAHFKGSALLSIELTELSVRGKRITLVTDTYSKEGEGRGKNTVEKAGGGAALGAVIGALAGGGRGAAIGGLAGGAAGTGVNAATRGQQVIIPTETLVNFRLQSPITLTVIIPPPGSAQPEDQSDKPQLIRR